MINRFEIKLFHFEILLRASLAFLSCGRRRSGFWKAVVNRGILKDLCSSCISLRTSSELVCASRHLANCSWEQKGRPDASSTRNAKN